MTVRTRLFFFFIAALLAGASLPLLAVIDVRRPLGKLYAVDSRIVFAAEITSMNADTSIIEAKTTTVYKSQGSGPAKELKFLVQKDAAALLADLAAKDASKSIVLFEGQRTVAVYLGDHGYTAVVGGTPGSYIIKCRNQQLDTAYAGKTDDLVKEVEKLQQQAKEGPATGPSTAPAK